MGKVTYRGRRVLDTGLSSSKHQAKLRAVGETEAHCGQSRPPGCVVHGWTQGEQARPLCLVSSPRG